MPKKSTDLKKLTPKERRLRGTDFINWKTLNTPPKPPLSKRQPRMIPLQSIHEKCLNSYQQMEEKLEHLMESVDSDVLQNEIEWMNLDFVNKKSIRNDFMETTTAVTLPHVESSDVKLLPKLDLTIPAPVNYPDSEDDTD